MLVLDIYKKIYLIRAAEKAIIENYQDDEMKTPMHMSMGAEAIAVGVCLALKAADQIFGTYRSHAVYFAKDGDLDKFFGEMYGKVTGVVHGKGGSMHLSFPEKNFMATSAVVASTISVSVGAAYANKLASNSKIVAVFFGDGAIDEGAFWESLNLACLLKLPILFVLEDNGLAVHTPDWQRHGYLDIDKIVSQFQITIFSTNTTDSEKIHKLTKKAIGAIKKTGKPVFLHLKYYRYLEHVGVNYDFDRGYRKKTEYNKWLKVDPVKIMRIKLLKSGFMENKVREIEKRIDEAVQASLKKAQRARFPKSSELFKDIFYEKRA